MTPAFLKPSFGARLFFAGLSLTLVLSLGTACGSKKEKLAEETAVVQDESKAPETTKDLAETPATTSPEAIPAAPATINGLSTSFVSSIIGESVPSSEPGASDGTAGSDAEGDAGYVIPETPVDYNNVVACADLAGTLPSARLGEWTYSGTWINRAQHETATLTVIPNPLEHTQLLCQINNDDPFSCPAQIPASMFLREGIYDFKIYAYILTRDPCFDVSTPEGGPYPISSGNPSIITQMKIDLTAPSIVFQTVPGSESDHLTSAQNLSLRVLASDNLTRLVNPSCRLRDEAGNSRDISCISPLAPSYFASGVHQYTILASARDQAGNVPSEESSYSWRVDNQAPVITSISPPQGTLVTDPTGPVVIRFSEAMSPVVGSSAASLVLNHFVSDTRNLNVAIPTTLSFSEDRMTLTVTPSVPVSAYDAQYTLTLANLTDDVGNALVSFNYPLLYGAGDFQQFGAPQQIASGVLTSMNLMSIEHGINGGFQWLWGDSTKISQQFLDSNGVLQGSPAELALGSAAYQFNDAGRGLLAWHSGSKIYVKHFDPQTGWDNTATELGTSSTSISAPPSVAINGSGSIVVLWWEKDSQLRGSHFNGTSWVPSYVIQAAPSFGASRTRSTEIFLELSAAGDAVASWREPVGTSSTKKILKAVRSSNGFWPAVSTLSSCADCEIRTNPLILKDAQNNFAVYWRDHNSLLQLNRSTASTPSWGASISLNVSLFSNCDQISGSLLTGSQFVVVCGSSNSFGSDLVAKVTDGQVAFQNITLDSNVTAFQVLKGELGDIDVIWLKDGAVYANHYFEGKGWGAVAKKVLQRPDSQNESSCCTLSLTPISQGLWISQFQQLQDPQDIWQKKYNGFFTLYQKH